MKSNSDTGEEEGHFVSCRQFQWNVKFYTLGYIEFEFDDRMAYPDSDHANSIFHIDVTVNPNGTATHEDLTLRDYFFRYVLR